VVPGRKERSVQAIGGADTEVAVELEPSLGLAPDAVSPPRGRRSLEMMETLLWSGGRQIQAGRQGGRVDPQVLRQWHATWLALLDRYERYCGEPELLLPPRRRPRNEDLQLALLPRLAAVEA
jgi:hypothetical protein